MKKVIEVNNEKNVYQGNTKWWLRIMKMKMITIDDHNDDGGYPLILIIGK